LVARPRDAIEFGRVHREPGVLHLERPEDPRGEVPVERLSGQLLDEVALDVHAGSVPPVGTGLRRERQPGELVDHPLQIRLAQPHVGIPAVDVEAGGMTHQLPHRHRRRRCREAGLCLHTEVLELRNEVVDGIVQLPLPLFPQRHHRDADDGFGHRGKAEDRVICHRRSSDDVLEPVRVEHDDLAMPRDERRHAREALLVDEGVQCLLVRFQARRRKTDRFGRGELDARALCEKDAEGDRDQGSRRQHSTYHGVLLAFRRRHLMLYRSRDVNMPAGRVGSAFRERLASE
jgi:hypothetical protein